MSQLTIHLLGTPRIELDSTPITIDRRKVLALLAYLALTQHAHRRDHLATLFWPGYDQTSARANLRRALSILNKSLGGTWLQSDRETVALKRDNNFWLDVDQFHQRLTDCTAHGHLASEVCSDCLEPLNQAVTLYQDDLLTGFTLPDSPEFDDWQLFQTESLRRELAEVLEKLVRGHSVQNELELAIACARRWLALDPLEEVAHRHLMQLLTLNGKRNAALTQYDTCRKILSDELGVEPTAETTALFQQIRKDEFVGENFASTILPPRFPTPQHNLPAQLTSFIGRKEELTEIARLIHNKPTCQLLTLVGPGGIGKTRLAIQAAVDLVDAFQHSVYFIPLAPISAAESVIPTLADALNFPLSGSQPKEQLLNYLRQKELLLVLDNFEHLIPEGATDLVSEIVTTAPQVKLLVTSRERLNLQEEWSIEVQGMSVPSRDEAETKSLETFDAIQLFLQRAGRTRPGFTLSPENSHDVVAICQLVDGMPLGLELAAAWLRMMSSEEIRQEIQRNLDFLTTPVRNVPERHQNLRAVFEHSWQLLSEEEQSVFRKLSVFRGGFRRRAAERVANVSLPLLSGLVDKSLLRRTRSGRYEIHELLRQYATEKLNEVSDENEQAQDRHAEYYLTFLQQRTDALKGARQEEVLAEITADMDNVRAGWQRAVAQKNVANLGKAANGLFDVGARLNWFQEGEAAFRLAVQSLTEEHPDRVSKGGEQTKHGNQKTRTRHKPISEIQNLEDIQMEASSKIVLAQLLRGQGLFSAWLGFIEPGQDMLRQSVSLLRQTEDGLQPELALSLHELTFTYYIQGRYSEVKQHAQESLAVSTEAGDRWGMGRALLSLGWVATYQGDYVEANQHLRESRRLFKQTGDRRYMTLSIQALGILARTRGEYSQAERFFEEGLQNRLDLDDWLGRSFILRELGYLAIARGNYSQAKTRLQECLTITMEAGARAASVFPLDGLGAVARLKGEYQQAEQLHQESLAICRESDERRGIALCLHNLGRLAYDTEDYPTAEQCLQESLTRYKEIGHRYGVASTLCYLGYVACASQNAGRYEANQYFRQALEIAAGIGANPVTLDILVGLATLLSTRESGNSEQERAVELLALALHHPASEQEAKDKAKRLLDKLASSLPPELVAAAHERGQSKTLQTAITELDLEKNKI